ACSACVVLLLAPRATTETYALSLHDALPISRHRRARRARHHRVWQVRRGVARAPAAQLHARGAAWRSDRARAHLARGSVERRATDRKSTRLNSSHVKISYAVFCLKKKNIEKI